MVENNDIEKGMKHLNGIMSNEGLFQRWMATRRYEKPHRRLYSVLQRSYHEQIHQAETKCQKLDNCGTCWNQRLPAKCYISKIFHNSTRV